MFCISLEHYYRSYLILDKATGNLNALERTMSISVMISDRVSDKGGRRVGIDRREFSFTAYAPERRSGRDRRTYEDRRQTPRILTYLKNLKNKLSDNGWTWKINPSSFILYYSNSRNTRFPSQMTKKVEGHESHHFSPALAKAWLRRSNTAGFL